MSGGLVIRLRPHEKFLVNGVVLENGEKRAKLRIKSHDANLLRLRDALHPNEATTPVKRLYYVAQLIVTGDLEPDIGAAELISGLNALYDALSEKECRDIVDQTQKHLNKKAFYQVMRSLRSLFPYEEKLLLIAHANQLRQLGESEA
jgi:flagellar biosynthesis repressor protein FlbT